MIKLGFFGVMGEITGSCYLLTTDRARVIIDMGMHQGEKEADAHNRRMLPITVLPKRWIVERTLGWLGRHRRMSKDYEMLPASSEAMVYIVMINVMLHRLVPG